MLGKSYAGPTLNGGSMQFDARAAKLLAAGQHFTISDCPGLRLEATKSKRSWIYRYKSPLDGRMRQTKIGEWPAISLAAATVEWERLRGARSAGVDLAVDKREVRAQSRQATEAERERKAKALLTVRRVADMYVAGHLSRNRGEKGVKEVTRMFETMLGEFGDMPAAEVSRSDAFDLIEGFAHIPVQAAKLRAELGSAWDYVHDAGRLPDTVPNWWRLIMRGKLRSKGRVVQGVQAGPVKRVLSAEELATLIKWLPNFSKAVCDALTLYLWTCTRGSEIMAMEVTEISEEADGLWWTIPKAKTKNSWREHATDLRVPLVGRAEVVVRRRMGAVKGKYLFESYGKVGYMEQKSVGCAVWMHMPYSETKPEGYRPRLPVTNWAPHDLRRSCRTQLAILGCPEEVAEAVLGHMKKGVVGVYNRHAYDRERREWLERLNTHLEAL